MIKQQFAAAYRAIRAGASIESLGYSAPYSVLRAAGESKLSRERSDRRTLSDRLEQHRIYKEIFKGAA